jgi:AcrR family transcriptional regulator
MPEQARPGTKSKRTRQRILDAAARIFREKGYAATRLSDIAAVADTRAGSLYYHFDSKEQLLNEVLERGHGNVAGTVRARVEALGPNARYQDRLRTAIRAHLESVFQRAHYAAADIHLHEQIPQAVRRRHIRKHRAYAAYWQDLLAGAQAAGAIRKDVDVSMARLNLFGMMNWSIEWYRPRRLGIEEVAANMFRTFFEGIAGPGDTWPRSES